MTLTPPIGSMPILERWIAAADRLGPTASGYGAYLIPGISAVMETCREPLLARNLRHQGPFALCQLNSDERTRIINKTEPTMGAGLRHLLLQESLSMERMVGTELPCRFLIFGDQQPGKIAQQLLDREFPGQRGAAFSLTRPSSSLIATLSQTRHQLFWPEKMSSAREDSETLRRKVRRLPLAPAEPLPGELWNLKRLARINLTGVFYSSFAAKSFVAMDAGAIFRFGGLSVLNGFGGEPLLHGPDILLTGGLGTISKAIPVAIVSTQGETPGFGIPREGSEAEDRVRIHLGNATNYGRIDFDPHDRRLRVSVLRTKGRSVLSETVIRLQKDERIARVLNQARTEVHADLTEALYHDLKGIQRRQRAEAQADTTLSLAFPLVGHYIEWIESHPEAPIAEREERLASLEQALLQDLPPELEATHRDLVRRDFFRVFQSCLNLWGAGAES